MTTDPLGADSRHGLAQPPGRQPSRIGIAEVEKSFAAASGVTRAVERVSLDVAPGEFVALLGPSGCGKTTLLNLVAGLIFPDRGEVHYAGQRVTRPNGQTGYLTQDDALLPWRTVAANVGLPLEIKRIDKAERMRRTGEILHRVGLAGFERHFPHQVSGGMRKRVSLARTLVYQPETLLLDEPFGALDAQTKILMQRELLSIVRQLDLTVLLVTHDLDEAIALADRVILFSRRPATIIETIKLKRRTPEQVGQRVGKDDKIYDQIWQRLALEITEVRQ